MLVFCYGALLNLKIWREYEGLLLEPKFICLARLNDYELIFDGVSPRTGGATGNIKPCPGKVVWGVLFEVSEEESKVVDRYEGVPNNYNRQEVVVCSLGADDYKVQVYLRTGREAGKPSQKYLDILLEGAKYFGLPADYIANLES